MAIPIQDVYIEVYLGHDRSLRDGDPDLRIPTGDIEEAEINARSGEVMDEAKFTITDPNDRYTEEYPLKQADRLAFVSPTGDARAYGDGYYGGGMYGSANVVEWTGRITKVEKTREAPTRATLKINARDYPADILANRRITNSYVDRDVGWIIRDICRRKAPEVDRTQIEDLGVKTDVKYTSVDCWDAVMKLAARADAVVIPERRSIRVERVDGLPFAFDVNDDDLFLPVDMSVGDDIKNAIRVDSGENRKLEESQEAVDADSFVRVTDSNRITKRLRARKAQVQSVELYVQADADERLAVRLQSDEGGSPVAIDDQDSDIASTSWELSNLPEDDWKTFFFPDHTLADRDPWLIIEAGADGGHDIGHNASGELAYRSFYPHPLNFEVDDRDSIREYGARELRVERENLKTLTAARDAARAELARKAWPSKTIEFEARSSRMHRVEPGDRLNFDRPQDGITGEHIVTEVQAKWTADSTVLETSITADWRKGILAPVQ